MPTPTSIYLHFPFCLRKCDYCDFASWALADVGGLDAARRYLDALLIELDLRAATEEFADSPVDTIYLGGGTPTVLPSEWLAEVLDRVGRRFPVDADAEVTVEANPGTVDRDSAAALLSAGVNRVSLGVQSFRDDELRLLGRVHDAAAAQEAVRAARAAGCRNLGLDLIYGLPGQKVEAWKDTLERAVAARPEHMSAYALSVEEGTPLAQRIAAGELPEPDDDATADMYALAAEKLSEAGYEHYEVSNFALPGRECRHNRRYWSGDEYLGAGCSAHSHRRGIRWNNAREPRVYVSAIEAGRLPVVRAEALSARERVGEMLMLGLRTVEGVSEQEVSDRCGLSPRDVFAAEIEQLCGQGLLIAEQGRLKIPRERWLVSNEVLSHFVG